MISYRILYLTSPLSENLNAKVFQMEGFMRRYSPDNS